MKLIALTAALAAAIALTVTPMAASQDPGPEYTACTPIAAIPYVGLTNYAGNRGSTAGCGEYGWYEQGYYWAVGIVDADTSEILQPTTGGFYKPSAHSGSANLLLDFEVFAMCLRANGTGRNVKSITVIQLAVPPSTVRYALSPGTAVCKRIGGTSVEP